MLGLTSFEVFVSVLKKIQRYIFTSGIWILRKIIIFLNTKRFNRGNKIVEVALHVEEVNEKGLEVKINVLTKIYQIL